MTTTPNSFTLRQVLALQGVRRLWLGQLVSIGGDFLAIFAVLSMISFRMHGTPGQLTGVTISYMLPLALFGPVAGVFVDRWNPRRTMIASDLVRAGLALLLIFATRLSEIYTILFAISAVSTLFIPAQSIAVRTLVPREGLLAANTVLQQAMLVVRMVSPALAGALVGRLGPNSCFALDSLSFLFSGMLLAGVAFTRPPTANAQPMAARTVISDISAGVRFIISHPGIGFVMTAMASATFAISCFSPLLAVLVRDTLHGDARVYGAISSMISLGMIAGMYRVRRWRRSSREIIQFSLAVIASGIVLMGASSSPVITALGAWVMGAGVGTLMVPAQTMIQSETPLPMLGRVSSGVMSLISFAQILGLLLSGASAAVIGVRSMFFLSAGYLILLVLPKKKLDVLNTVK